MKLSELIAKLQRSIEMYGDDDINVLVWDLGIRTVRGMCQHDFKVIAEWPQPKAKTIGCHEHVLPQAESAECVLHSGYESASCPKCRRSLVGAT